MRYSIILVLLLLGSVTKAQQDTLIIHFDIDKADIRPPDRTSLDSLVRTPVRLAGHTDNSGSDAHNIQLSQQRAQVVRDYLKLKGWPDGLFLTMDGFGSSRPLNDNSSVEKKSLNRRVEIIIQRPIPRPSPSTVSTVEESPDDPNTTIYHRPPSLAEIFKDTANLVGKNFVLHDVNFYGDRHIPLPGSTIVLQELAVIMKEFPTLHIEIQGYVCCMSDGFDGRDADTGTPDLSTQRAKFVYEFLVNQGIKKNRMTYKGFGAGNKIFPEERDESQKTGNRRVEIKIVSFGIPR